MAQSIKVMISSTRADLMQYREVASDVIKEVAEEREETVQLIEVSMEKETQSGDREFAVAVSKKWVEKADWVVLIVGWNYGTISTEDGADGLSVTAWEYQHAIEKKKKVFVFIAGDPGTTNEYSKSSEEKHNLKDDFFSQTEDQRKKLEAFRKELSSSHAELFSNLSIFRARLKKTLIKNIDDFDIPPEGCLAQLIVAVSPEIRNCTRKVKLIAHCKQIHDHLHEMRQHVIIPLREEVLVQWQEEGELSRSREKVMWRLGTWALRQMDGIIAKRRLIDENEHRVLRETVDRVLILLEFLKFEEDICMEEFAERLDEFGEAVQDAFSEADRSMATVENDLREGYLLLLDVLKKERQRCPLDSLDKGRLGEELVKIKGNREQIQNVLTNHHQWQASHDKLYGLEAFRETKAFGKKFKYFCDSWLPTKLVPLVKNEMETAAADDLKNDSMMDQPCVSGERGGVVSETEECPDVCSNFTERLQLLHDWLGSLKNDDGMERFDEIHKPFDLSFFCVDKRTLKKVRHAEKRVHDLESWLDDLARRKRDLD